MKKILLPVLLIHSLIISGCSTISASDSETNGQSLLHDRRSQDAILSDESIEVNANIKLNDYDGLRDTCRLKITAYNGVVLVTGEVPNEEFRNRIIDIVRVIPSVKLVHDKLTIVNDALITDKVKTALTQIPEFDPSWVKVITEKGTVYLMGLVHKNEGAAAIEAARHQSDVKQIITVFEYID